MLAAIFGLVFLANLDEAAILPSPNHNGYSNCRRHSGISLYAQKSNPQWLRQFSKQDWL